MKNLFLVVAFLSVLGLCSQAQAGVVISFGFGGGGCFQPGYYPPPCYYRPAPYYYRPPPCAYGYGPAVYYRPAPCYYRPPPPCAYGYGTTVYFGPGCYNGYHH